MNKKGFIGTLPADLFSIIGTFLMLAIFLILFILFSNIKQVDYEIKISNINHPFLIITYLRQPIFSNYILGDNLALQQQEQIVTEKFFENYLNTHTYGTEIKSLDSYQSLKSAIPINDNEILFYSNIIIPTFNRENKVLIYYFTIKNE